MTHLPTFSLMHRSSFYDPTVSIKKVINRYLKIKTSSSVHCLASNSNTNTMILKLKKFKCQFTPIKWYVSNDLFQKAITKSFCNCVFIVLYAYLSCSLLSSGSQIIELSATSGSIFLYKRDSSCCKNCT